MRKHKLSRRQVGWLGVALLAAMAALGCSRGGEEKPSPVDQGGGQKGGPEAKGPKPLPPEVVEAWEKAGTWIGWMGQGQDGFLTFRRGGEGKAGEVPAFRLYPWKAGVLANLPPPSAAFGLSLGLTLVTDPGL